MVSDIKEVYVAQVSETRETTLVSGVSLHTLMALFLSLTFSLFSAWSLIRLPGNINPFANVFRGYFPSDQLSYAGIAASAKAGQFGLVEPFTQTGSSYYPNWWYKFIGLFASVTGLEVSSAWSILGFGVILGSVLFIGIAAWRITGKSWAPLVVGLLIWIGPLASILFNNWFVNLESHAVMWGPYGALYPLNGEAAGLSVGSVGLVLGYWVAIGPQWPKPLRLTLFGLAGLMLGLIANIQTYSFLTLTAITLWIAAVGGLLRSRSRKIVGLTVALVALIAVVAPLIRDSVGALPIYVLMLVPTLPGIWALVKGRMPFAFAGLIFFLLGAAPQVMWMAVGTLDQDPFLTYRVDQSGELGIPLWAFLLYGSPVLLTWAAILRVQIARKGTKEIALLVGWFVAFVLLSFNNSWGFGQEPYRFWINSVIVFVFIAALTLPRAELSRYFSTRSAAILSTLAVVLVAASFWNVGAFRAYVSSQGNIDFNSTQLQGIAELVSENNSGEGLVTAEPCINPRHLKVATGVPVAFYNLGLAWPEKKNEIDDVIAAGDTGVLDTDLMRSAGISYLLTDSSCPTAWDPSTRMGVTEIAQTNYLVDADVKTLTLWRLF
jgi:hypothetical protein